MKNILTISRKPDISFHASGKIDISAHLVRRLSLAPGDIIDIARDEKECYIYIRHRARSCQGRHDGRVMPVTAGRKGTFRCWSRTLARAVLDMAGAPSRLRCPCGADLILGNTKYITIIYRCSL